MNEWREMKAEQIMGKAVLNLRRWAKMPELDRTANNNKNNDDNIHCEQRAL